MNIYPLYIGLVILSVPRMYARGHATKDATYAITGKNLHFPPTVPLQFLSFFLHCMPPGFLFSSGSRRSQSSLYIYNI